jgi:hypothetical protein
MMFYDKFKNNEISLKIPFILILLTFFNSCCRQNTCPNHIACLLFYLLYPSYIMMCLTKYSTAWDIVETMVN